MTVVLDPTWVRATVDGTPTPEKPIDLSRLRHVFPKPLHLDGELLAPLGEGIGLFTFGGDTAFRNVTIRRPR